MTHRRDQWWGDCLREWGRWVGDGNGGKIRTTVCVVTVQGWACSGYSCRWKHIYRVVGMSGMPLFMGG